MYKILLLVILIAVSGLAINSYADRMRAPVISNESPALCEINTLNVNFTYMEKGVKNAKAKFDSKLAEVKAAAKELEIKVNIDNYNYNLSQQNYSGYNNDNQEEIYNVSGSFSFRVNPANKAAALMEKLNKLKLNTSLSVSAYRNANCPVEGDL